MDLMRMGTDYVPDELIESYDSAIWTERYQDAGEFQIVTKNIDKTLALLPKGSLLAERNSQEVMIVENHEISDTTDDSEGPVLTTTGRTFETFMEQRATVVVNSTPGQEAMITYKADDIWPTDAAKALIESHLTISPDAVRQKVPNTAVENLVTTHTGQDMSYENEPGPLYDQVLNLIKMEGAGIRNQQNFQGTLKMYIYKGVDRSASQSARPPLIFSLDAGHLINPKYLFSIKDYKNLAYVVGTYWQQRVYAPGVSDTVSGLDRRIVVVNGDEIKQASSTTKKTKQARALGLAELAKHNKTTFFDGEVSPESPYIRGVDYNLGDQVTLMANYGVSQTMIISEFVRTEDQEGERAYPTLSSPSLDDDGL